MGLREQAGERRRPQAGITERWKPGDTVLWTYLHPCFPDLRDVYPVTVVSDDERGLPEGAGWDFDLRAGVTTPPGVRA